jgi:predicted DNA-binding protein with PD1-like motif
MKSKLINDGLQRTYVLVLDKGDEAVGSIEGFARENRIAAAQLTGIGAFQRCGAGILRLGDEGLPENPGERAGRGRLAPR